MNKDFCFKSAYIALNSSFNEKLIYPLTDRGLGSELNNLLLTAVYCLVNKKQLVLYDSNWNSGRFVDYFEPFCERFKGIVEIPNYIFGDGGKKRRIYKKIHYYLYPSYQLLDSSVWKEIRNPKLQSQKIKIPELAFNGSSFDLLYILEKYLLQYNTKTKKIIHKEVNKRNWNTFSGIHVRRGDKLIREAGLFIVKCYLEKGNEKGFDMHDLFVASDNFQVLEELENYNSYIEYISYCEPSDNGHHQKSFNNQTMSNIESQVLRLLIEIEILSLTKCFVGTFSSNIGRLVHLKRNTLNSYSLDSDWSL